MGTPAYRIKAPAKINVRLKITGRRQDGYHELVSVMVPVSLLDILEAEKKGSKGIDLTVTGIPVPVDDRNLVIRAARAFFSRTGLDEGISFRLSKIIPVAAGLGGGSSDAAATLNLLNDIYGIPLSASDLHNIALQLGADIPFFLRSGPCLATGIGEVLDPIEKWPEFWYVIVAPCFQVSTAWVYRNFKMKLTIGEYAYIKSILDRFPLVVSQILENDLESVTSARFPVVDAIKRLLIEMAAEGALMSGSGPSVFGVFGSLEKAEAAKEVLASRGLGDVFLVTDWKKERSLIL